MRELNVRIGLAWPPGVTSGWGVLALNMTLEMLDHPEASPFLILPPHTDLNADPALAARLAPLAAEQVRLQALLDGESTRTATLNHPVIHSLTNHCQWGTRISERVKGQGNLAYIFLEDTNLTPEDRSRAERIDLILAGCSWNETVLRSNGIANVTTVLQGVDTCRFTPGTRTPIFPGKFVVFGGGTLTYRKGQDIVAAAFKAFHRRHPDAFLLTAWQNPFPETVRDIATSGLMQGFPAARAAGGIDIKGWLVGNGIPPEACHDVGAVPNSSMADIYRQADVALFPNRAEGGTNMVAMEAMACGIPCLISEGHGHLDLIAPNRANCLPLPSSGPCPPVALGRLAHAGMDGWIEVSVESCVEALEVLYQDRERAGDMGRRGADFMRPWSWKAQTARVVELAMETLG
ncbi:MAG: hypothetical protein A2516_06060 [Alphaproteobacteria bacterium RIFOXYD12_FULL_60_8]|nr:MAG: hypothetical protein A2516_06060 [Alphaproteobacteria bacterium RIFOXYD12_FULL_60_8]